MKYLSEYRDRDKVSQLVTEIRRIVTRSWKIMEICGGQTHSLVRNGILDMLPREITMVHGPGCPVCVTPVEMIDMAIYLAEQGYIICSFGDMLRVPGSTQSLLEVKAQGGQVEVVYSPLEAVQYAKNYPDREVVFFAVGFETTAPANALSVIIADKEYLANFSLLVSHVLVPPAMQAILDDEENQIDGFLAAGHVCAVTGYEEYHEMARKYRIPIVVTGFEPVDLLTGILKTVAQLESGTCIVENAYERVVNEEGNRRALQAIESVFEITDRNWRGIGLIQKSGLGLRNELRKYDAQIKFETGGHVSMNQVQCMAGKVLTGQMKPSECPHFGIDCTPANPLGAPMVSSEGACAAYHQFSQDPVPSS